MVLYELMQNVYICKTAFYVFLKAGGFNKTSSSKQAVEGSNPSAITTLWKPRPTAWFFNLWKSQTLFVFWNKLKETAAIAAWFPICSINFIRNTEGNPSAITTRNPQ
ncbi:hypothetical protein KCTC52924_02666 [Arenibacter antarcticus]|uniref:Uncharacterized protein n=1 Tax=Arenibacter antarcticus TaxID=2040469 RepID=A0ABW5VIN5_9FLAO|nr:hypothetical protein [Arenibacter sp. H213]MCM4167089.1 hypothetical protein [Arenibacter sp. H213]